MIGLLNLLFCFDYTLYFALVSLNAFFGYTYLDATHRWGGIYVLVIRLITYLCLMSKYLYNITIHAERACAADVAYYLEHRVFDAWSERDGWQNGRMLRIPTPEEDGASIAIQFEVVDATGIESFEIEKDPSVQRIRAVYGDRVQFYPTLMEVIR